jgi:hypothetical protein
MNTPVKGRSALRAASEVYSQPRKEVLTRAGCGRLSICICVHACSWSAGRQATGTVEQTKPPELSSEPRQSGK